MGDSYSYLKADHIDLDVYSNDFDYDDAVSSFTSMLNNLGIVYTLEAEGELFGWKAENVDGCFVIQLMLESLTNHFTLAYKDGGKVLFSKSVEENTTSPVIDDSKRMLINL